MKPLYIRQQQTVADPLQSERLLKALTIILEHQENSNGSCTLCARLDQPPRAVRNRARWTRANSNLGNGNLRPETFGKTRQELPLRIAGPLLRPVLGEASYGNVVLSCREGNHVNLRGLPGGAEGIRTSDLRSAGTRALNQ